ncbi:MAG: hypothetical protein ACYTBJ_19885 [Planctomycetota bacterium]|jgi:hypothetical protein
MEQVCGNCEYFVQVGSSSELEAWGDCMNPEATWVNEKGETKGVFRWADGSCMDFKPTREPRGEQRREEKGERG